MDVGAAFTYMFDDEEWVKKLAIGGGIVLGSAILIPAFLLGVALFLPVLGYMMEVLKNVRDNRPLPLPEWANLGGLFKLGFMALVITLVYNIPVIILLCALVSVQALPGLIDMNSEAVGGIFAAMACLYAVLFLVSALVNAILPAGLIRYAQFGSLGSAFQFGKIFSFISSNLGDYVIAVILMWVANFLANFGMLLCGIGLFFTFFWSLLVTGHLYGQLAQRVQPELAQNVS